MTPEEFTKDEVNRLELQKLLQNPVLMLALSVLKAELEPKSAGNDAISNPVLGASKYQQLAGANHMISGLERLTTPLTPLKKLTGRPPLT